jgi:hypothetical protein
MTRMLLAIGLILTLTNCGADGAPTAPSASGTDTTQKGTTITVTGDAQMGVTNQ